MLSDHLRAVMALDPSARELEFGGRWFTWGELADAANRIGAALRDAGAGEAANIGIIMRNTPAVVATALAAACARQCMVTLSHLQPPAHLYEDVERLDLAAVVGDARDWTDELRAHVTASGALGLEVDELLGDVRVVVPAGDIADRTSPGIAVQMLSSGTTGRPKRIPLAYANLERSYRGVTRYEKVREDRPRLATGVAIVAQPLLHIGGLWFALFHLVSGRAFALLERFDLDQWLARVREHRPASIALPPAALKAVYDADVPVEDLACVKAVTCGAAPVRPEFADAFTARYGAPVLIVYGATEFAGGVAGWTLKDHREWWDRKKGSVGRAHEGVELQVVDETTGAVLAPGEPGLLEVRSSQLATDGWVRSTDRASLDADGFLFIHGRADDVINRGGFKIDAGHVARVLAEHPQITEASVVGVPDDRLGEIPVAVVESPADELDTDAVRAWARERLTPYQVPVRVVVVDALPRTPSTKVSQQQVRELLAARPQGVPQ